MPVNSVSSTPPPKKVTKLLATLITIYINRSYNSLTFLNKSRFSYYSGCFVDGDTHGRKQHLVNMNKLFRNRSKSVEEQHLVCGYREQIDNCDGTGNFG